MIIDSLSLMECVANTLLISVGPMLIVSLTEYKYRESKLMKHIYFAVLIILHVLNK